MKVPFRPCWPLPASSLASAWLPCWPPPVPCATTAWAHGKSGHSAQSTACPIRSTCPPGPSCSWARSVPVAHFFVADRNPNIAPSDLQFLDDGQDGLATGGARIFNRLDRLTGESRNLGHEACEQSVLVQEYIASGAHGAYIDRGGFHFDFRTGLCNGALKNLGHRHAHEFPEFRLMIGSDVNALHKAPP